MAQRNLLSGHERAIFDRFILQLGSIHDNDNVQQDSTTFVPVDVDCPEQQSSPPTRRQQPQRKRFPFRQGALPKDEEPFNLNTSRSSKRRSSVQNNSRVSNNQGPLLTEAERRAHHVSSEQRRRRTIREGFERLLQRLPEAMALRQANACIKRTSEAVLLRLGTFQISLSHPSYSAVDRIESAKKRIAELEAELGVSSHD